LILAQLLCKNHVLSGLIGFVFFVVVIANIIEI
jgi:hypothetical protein